MKTEKMKTPLKNENRFFGQKGDLFSKIFTSSCTNTGLGDVFVAN